MASLDAVAFAAVFTIAICSSFGAIQTCLPVSLFILQAPLAYPHSPETHQLSIIHDSSSNILKCGGIQAGPPELGAPLTANANVGTGCLGGVDGIFTWRYRLVL